MSNNSASRDPAAAPSQEAPLLAGIVRADTPALTAAAHILDFQFALMRGNRDLALTGSDPEYLHDFRVAARRFRAALSFFKPLMRQTPAKRCGRLVGDFRRRLGPVRDAHVWLLFLEELATKPSFAKSTPFRDYLESCRVADVRQTATLESILTSDAYTDVIGTMSRFLDVELAEAERNGTTPGFGPFAAERLRESFRRILKSDARVKHMTDESIHALRKKCRKARYYAEFSAGSLGKPIERLARRFKQVTTALGDIHDMDVRLQAIASGEAAIPPILTDAIHSHRRRAVRAFEKVWKDLGNEEDRKDTRKALRTKR